LPESINLRDGDVFELRALPVRKRLGVAEARMLGYNGSIPGPTLRVEQGSEVTVDFTNETDLESTVHWHGLRLDNRFDGVPKGAHHGMQPPIAREATSATSCASPTRASTGATRISGRTTRRR
jgi:FtsP/CotA-like multicopper oxidase with cupredoxin domain